MMQFSVRFSNDAEEDLFQIGAWIGAKAGTEIARGYVDQIMLTCQRLVDHPFAGSPRDDIAVGLRSKNYRRRTTIFYTIVGDEVVVIHILYGGRDVERAFGLTQK